MKIVMHKLRNASGESLVEVLVAILISGLSMLVLATTIASAYSMINASKEAEKNYYAEIGKLASKGDSSGNVIITVGSKANPPVQVWYAQADDLPHLPGTAVVGYSYVAKQ